MVLAAAASMALSGCGQSVAGQAVIDSVPSEPLPASVRPAVAVGDLFDPCSLPIESVDADNRWDMTQSPAPASVGGCMWTSADFSVSVAVYVEPNVLISSPDSNTNVVDLQRVEVGEATFDVFALGGVGGKVVGTTCFGQTNTAGGGVMLNATSISSSGPNGSCDVLKDVVASLGPYLPAPA